MESLEKAAAFQPPDNGQWFVDPYQHWRFLTAHFRKLGIVKTQQPPWGEFEKVPTKKEIEQYFDWCKKNKFTATLGKSVKQRKNEVIQVSRESATRKMKKNRKLTRNSKKVVEAIFKGETDFPQGHFANDIVSHLRTVKGKQEKDDLKKLFTQLASRTKLLDNKSKKVTSILSVCRYYNEWIRKADNWIPDTQI